MLEQSKLRFLAQLALYCVFLVIIAGSIVRVTGSGMGCPDWPKCFGYYIPPVDVETLTYKENASFQKGQMVIHNDTLWVAQGNMMAGALFDHNQWSKYPKHDYAVFNPLHTWVEYINRLATVVLGLPSALLFVLTILWAIRKKDKIPMLWSGGAMLMLLFEAWLGKLVVDGNLVENSITYHMLGSLLLLLCLLALIQYLSPEKQQRASQQSVRWATAFLLLAFVQIILGTQVREEIDVLQKTGQPRHLWVDQLTLWFYVHRSFSIAMVLVFLGWMRNLRTHGLFGSQAKVLLFLFSAELAVGVVLAYLDMPIVAQPAHLFLGTAIFAITVGWRFRTSAVA